MVRYAQPSADTPGGLEEVVLPGKFSTPPGPKEQARLASAAVDWICSSVLAEVAR